MRHVCAICGQYLENGSCPRCASQSRRNSRFHPSSAKERRGPRPERRYTRRRLDDALDGEWVNRKYRITIEFDLDEGTYWREREGFGHKEHRLQVTPSNGNAVTFWKDGIKISGFINDDGELLLSSAGHKARFLYRFEGQLMLTCPQCFSKRLTTEPACVECAYE